MSKQFWAIIIVITLVFVGIFAISSNGEEKEAPKSSSSQGTNHVKGNPNSDIKLVEYGDYECPYCQLYFTAVQQVLAKYENEISFQFKNFPLSSIHPNAFAAARAAEAAGKQGKFWEMHDILYGATNWQAWTKATDAKPLFEQYATQLGLDMTKYKADFVSSEVNALINADISSGTALGVEGTPTFFLNGKKIDVSNNPADFEKVIDDAIAAQTKENEASN